MGDAELQAERLDSIRQVAASPGRLDWMRGRVTQGATGTVRAMDSDIEFLLRMVEALKARVGELERDAVGVCTCWPCPCGPHNDDHAPNCAAYNRGREHGAAEPQARAEAIVAQAGRLEAIHDRITTIADEAFGPFPVQSADESLTCIERGIFDFRWKLEEARARAEAAEARERALREAGESLHTALVNLIFKHPDKSRDDRELSAALNAWASQGAPSKEGT